MMKPRPLSLKSLSIGTYFYSLSTIDFDVALPVWNFQFNSFISPLGIVHQILDAVNGLYNNVRVFIVQLLALKPPIIG